MARCPTCGSSTAQSFGNGAVIEHGLACTGYTIRGWQESYLVDRIGGRSGLQRFGTYDEAVEWCHQNPARCTDPRCHGCSNPGCISHVLPGKL